MKRRSRENDQVSRADLEAEALSELTRQAGRPSGGPRRSAGSSSPAWGASPAAPAWSAPSAPPAPAREPAWKAKQAGRAVPEPVLEPEADDIDDLDDGEDDEWEEVWEEADGEEAGGPIGLLGVPLDYDATGIALQQFVERTNIRRPASPPTNFDPTDAERMRDQAMARFLEGQKIRARHDAKLAADREAASPTTNPKKRVAFPPLSPGLSAKSLVMQPVAAPPLNRPVTAPGGATAGTKKARVTKASVTKASVKAAPVKKVAVKKAAVKKAEVGKAPVAKAMTAGKTTTTNAAPAGKAAPATADRSVASKAVARKVVAASRPPRNSVEVATAPAPTVEAVEVTTIEVKAPDRAPGSLGTRARAGSRGAGMVGTRAAKAKATPAEAIPTATPPAPTDRALPRVAAASKKVAATPAEAPAPASTRKVVGTRAPGTRAGRGAARAATPTMPPAEVADVTPPAVEETAASPRPRRARAGAVISSRRRGS